MNIFLKNITVLIFTLLLVLLTSLLFELEFIQGHVSRQFVIWILIAVELYLGFNIMVIINKTRNTTK